MTLLLDTCTSIWLCSAPEKLRGPATKAFDRGSNDRARSLATVWEITPKYHSFRFHLPEQPDRWIEEQLKLQDIHFLPLQRTTLYRASALPLIHKDPFDRVIAADSLQRDLRVVSPDEPFRAYGCKVIW